MFLLSVGDHTSLNIGYAGVSTVFLFFLVMLLVSNFLMQYFVCNFLQLAFVCFSCCCFSFLMLLKEFKFIILVLVVDILATNGLCPVGEAVCHFV